MPEIGAMSSDNQHARQKYTSMRAAALNYAEQMKKRGRKKKRITEHGYSRWSYL
jgi:hypothetical protein